MPKQDSTPHPTDSTTEGIGERRKPVDHITQSHVTCSVIYVANIELNNINPKEEGGEGRKPIPEIECEAQKALSAYQEHVNEIRLGAETRFYSPPNRTHHGRNR